MGYSPWGYKVLDRTKGLSNGTTAIRQRLSPQDTTSMWNLILKNDTNEFIHKTETDLQTWKTNLWLPQGKGRGGGIN